MAEEELEQVVEILRDNSLQHTIQFGIGLHHAGLTKEDKVFFRRWVIYIYIILYIVYCILYLHR